MPTRTLLIRIIYSISILLACVATVAILLLLQSKTNIFNWSLTKSQAPELVIPFPVSVNAYTETITNNPLVEEFYFHTLANAPDSKKNWWNQIAATFASKDWYQNLASPVSRIIVIWPGERKEEVVKNIGDVLRWNESDRAEFQNLIDSSEPILREGKYFPGQYVTHSEATPADIKKVISDAFEAEILNRYTTSVAAAVPLEDALIIASLLEREASDFKNMREVSGVIWNRRFIDMPLQLDATLQYVRGSKNYEPKWWPRVRSQDKFLESPFNTYKHSGLPPAPIANPSTEAILAALNPISTECIFYFHTSDGGYHCSVDYEEHVEKLRAIYGRGS